MMRFLESRALRAAFVLSLVICAGSLAAVPITLKYQVTPLGGGNFQYDFILHVDNNDGTYAAGQGWRWLIFGDSPTSPSPLTGWAMSSGQFPVGPWPNNGFTGGSHNGPDFSYVLDYWVPSGIGDALHWRGTAPANLTQGQLLWSTLAGTLNGGVAANFAVAQRLDPGIRVDVTVGTAAVVLNNETGGGNGYQAAKFTLTNNGSAAATVSNIQIRGMGNGNHLASYTNVRIFRDQPSSGTVGSYDTGDQLIDTASFSGTPPLASFAVSGGSEQAFAVSEVKTYFIVVMLNGSAPASDTLAYRVENVTVGGGAILFGVPSRTMAGLFILGPEVAYDGFAPTVNRYVVPGITNHTMMAFRLGATTTNAQTISSITATRTGTITDANVTAVRLFEDTNGNRRLDSGEPQVGSTQTFSAGSVTFSGSPLISLAAGQQKNYVLTFSLAAGIANGTTMGASITPASGIPSSPGPTRQNTASPAFAPVINIVSTFPYTQNFDAFPYTGYTPTAANPLSAGWYNDQSDGGPDWMTYSGSTPTGGTGANADHTTGAAFYMYIEDDNFSSASGAINLITPAFDISALGAPAAEFWVHDQLNGSNPAHNNTLHVDWIDAVTGAVTNDIITPISGSNNANWFQVGVDLSAITANLVQIRIRWVGTGTSINNDICIDDFALRDAPEINVENASSTSIANGGTDPVGGVLTVGQNFTWTIENLGGVNLNLTGSPTVSTTNPSNVNATVTAYPATPIASMGSSTFTINVQPQGAGAFSFLVTIPNNDPTENPYTFTVSGTGVANQPPQVSIPGASNWVNTGGNNYTLTVNPGAAYNDSLEVTDPSPDNMTTVVTPPGTVPTTVTSQPASIGTPAAGPLTLTWSGTADATNPPGSYTWQISVNDTFNTVVINAAIVITDLPPTHSIGTDATSGDGLTVATAYNASALVGSTAALAMADISNPNTGQTMSLGTVTPGGSNPTGGSGFTVTLVSNTVMATPSAALQLADLGTHEFTVQVQDAGNTVTLYISITVVSPEIGVTRTGPIADGGTDSGVTGLVGQAQTFTYTISNTGTANLTVTTVVITGQNNCTASVTANPAGTVAPSTSTTFQVQFTPAAAGAFSFVVNINNDDVDESLYDFTVSGTATAAPEIDILRGATPVPSATTDVVGSSPFAQGTNFVYTIRNNGTANLTVTGASIGLTTNCSATVTAAPAGTVAPGATTTFTVLVTPTAAGLFTADVSVGNDDANENPYTFTLSGTGVSGGTTGGGGGGGGGGGCETGGGSLAWLPLLVLALCAAWAVRRRVA